MSTSSEDNISKSELVANDGENVLPTAEKLKLSWSGDLPSLKEFIDKTTDTNGVWSSPGGRKEGLQRWKHSDCVVEKQKTLSSQWYRSRRYQTKVLFYNNWQRFKQQQQHGLS